MNFFIPGKLYRLRHDLGFNEPGKTDGIWIPKNETLLLLDKKVDHKLVIGAEVILFLYDNKILYRITRGLAGMPESQHYCLVETC